MRGWEDFLDFRVCKVLPELKKGCRRPVGLGTSGTGTMALMPPGFPPPLIYGCHFHSLRFLLGKGHEYTHGGFVIYPYK